MAALAGAATSDEPSVKAMNNYLGIGIDAKVTEVTLHVHSRRTLKCSDDGAILNIVLTAQQQEQQPQRMRTTA